MSDSLNKAIKHYNHFFIYQMVFFMIFGLCFIATPMIVVFSFEDFEPIMIILPVMMSVAGIAISMFTIMYKQNNYFYEMLNKSDVPINLDDLRNKINFMKIKGKFVAFVMEGIVNHKIHGHIDSDGTIFYPEHIDSNKTQNQINKKQQNQEKPNQFKRSPLFEQQMSKFYGMIKFQRLIDFEDAAVMMNTTPQQIQLLLSELIKDEKITGHMVDRGIFQIISTSDDFNQKSDFGLDDWKEPKEFYTK